MMLDHVCQGPVILVASSLGAWVSFLEFVVLGNVSSSTFESTYISYLFSKLCSNMERQRSENGFCRVRHKKCRANGETFFLWQTL